jgi:Tfp pilus assembly protein PilF
MTAQQTELSDELRQQLDFINGEIQQFLDDELYHQGISRLDVILEGVPEDDDYRPLRGALCGRRAELLLELEEDEEAWEWAQKAMNAGWYDASVYSIAGWAMYGLDETDRAREMFDKALELDPDRLPSLNGRALVHMEMEEYDLARVDLSKAIQHDPEDASAYALRSEIGVYVGTVKSALRDIEKAREIDPHDPDYALFHARLLTATGDPDGGRQVLEEALDEEDATLEALLLRSQLRLLAGDVEAARKDAMLASNNFPDESFAFVVLSSIQLAQGNTALALKAAERAVKLDPSLPDAYMMRYAALKARGEDERAEEDLERAADEPTELFMFLLGPCFELADMSPLSGHMRQIIEKNMQPQVEPEEGAQEAAGPFGGEMPEGMPGGFPGLGGLGGPGPFGLDPMKMLNQVFDDDGNVRPTFKPILKMAMKNAPALLKTVPPNMLKNMGNIDPEQLENFDPSELSEEELEAQMRLFYKMVQAGQNPLDPGGDPSNDD